MGSLLWTSWLSPSTGGGPCPYVHARCYLPIGPSDKIVASSKRRGGMCRLQLASTSHDATLRLWDLAMLQEEPDEEEPQLEQQVHCQRPLICRCKYYGCKALPCREAAPNAASINGCHFLAYPISCAQTKFKGWSLVLIPKATAVLLILDDFGLRKQGL